MRPGPILLLAITVLFFWKLTLTGQYTWLNNPDMSNQVLPWLQVQAAEWHAGRFPLWDPHHWGGQSLIGQDQPGVVYPLNWALFLTPLRNGYLDRRYLNFYFVLIHYMGALFCYWLCRDLKRSPMAAMLAAVAFGMGGYVGSTNWPQMLNGAIWAPLVLLFFLRAMRGEHALANAAISGACLGISFLSGHHQIPTFVALMMAGCWLYAFGKRDWGPSPLLPLAGIWALFAGLLSAVQILPAYEYWKLALRWVNAAAPVGWTDKVPYVVHETYSLTPVSLLGILIPGVHTHADPFIGLVTVALAILAVVRAWNTFEVRLFGVIGLGGIGFALGGSSIFHGALYAVVPTLDKARSPSMAVLVFHLAVVVLAAYGLDTLRTMRLRDEPVVRYLIRALCIFAALVYAALVAGVLFQADKIYGQDWPAMAAFVALLIAAALAAWRSGALSVRGAATALLAILILELGFAERWLVLPKDLGWRYLTPLEENRDVVEFLRARPEPVRIGLNPSEIPFNFGDWHGIDQFGGYAGVTTNIIRLDGIPNAHLLMGENYYVGKTPARADQVEVFRGVSGFRVFRNPEAFPKVWAVHRAYRVANGNEVAQQFTRPLGELRQQTFLVGEPPALEQCPAGDTVNLIARQTASLAIDADMSCRGMVVVGDTFFPGWIATVDGRRVPIEEAYGVARGVVVYRGRHRIEMRYEPATVYGGALLSLLGGASAIALLLLTRLSRTGGGVPAPVYGPPASGLKVKQLPQSSA